jgi:hypothetical protein
MRRTRFLSTARPRNVAHIGHGAVVPQDFLVFIPATQMLLNQGHMQLFTCRFVQTAIAEQL